MLWNCTIWTVSDLSWKLYFDSTEILCWLLIQILEMVFGINCKNSNFIHFYIITQLLKCRRTSPAPFTINWHYSFLFKNTGYHPHKIKDGLFYYVLTVICIHMLTHSLVMMLAAVQLNVLFLCQEQLTTLSLSCWSTDGPQIYARLHSWKRFHKLKWIRRTKDLNETMLQYRVILVCIQLFIDTNTNKV